MTKHELPETPAVGSPVDRGVRPLVERLRRYGRELDICNEAADVIMRLRMFETRGDRHAIGLSKTHLQHLRWAIAKGLCTVEHAADALGADRNGLRSAIGMKRPNARLTAPDTAQRMHDE